MARRIGLKNPTEFSVPVWSIWDSSDFNKFADLTAISTWADKNGTGRDLSYVGTVKNPFVSAERLNGNKIIECDAVDSRMQLTSPISSNFTYSIVFKNIYNVATGYRVIDFGLSLRFELSNSSFQLAIVGGSTNVIPGFFGSQGVWNILTVTKQGTVLKVFLNGVLIYTRSQSVILYPNISLFGNDESFGASRFCKTYVAEVNTYTDAITEQEVLANQRYLKFKWGLL